MLKLLSSFTLIFKPPVFLNVEMISKEKDKWEFYKDQKTEWRWRRTAVNGRIVGASTEGYKNRLDCIENAKRNGYIEK